MRLLITADSDKDTKVGDVITKISGQVRKYFLDKDYGSSVSGIVIVLMCRDPKIVFKQRVRFLKKEKKLSTDIFIDYKSMLNASDDNERLFLIKDKISTELPLIVKKYALREFDLDKFIKDLQSVLSPSLKWSSVI